MRYGHKKTPIPFKNVVIDVNGSSPKVFGTFGTKKLFLSTFMNTLSTTYSGYLFFWLRYITSHTLFRTDKKGKTH